MRDWTSSGRLKIQRANEHVLDLERRIDAFREREPYEIVAKYELEFTDGSRRPVDGTSFHVNVRERPDPMWSCIAADAIHNLHVALDHLWQRAAHGTKHAARDHFPAYRSPEAAKARSGGENKRILKALKLLRQVNAFEVGNPFWAIRCFDDTDKHDTMTLVAVALPEFEADFTRLHGPEYDGSPRTFRPPRRDNWFLEHGHQLYYTTERVAQGDVDHHLPFEIAFGEGEVLKGEAVVPTIQKFSAEVDGLASAFLASGLVV
jgi:hypothetical protein